MNQIFVCYSRDDQDFVLKLAANLKQRGFPIWLDQWNISAGANRDRTIEIALKKCTHLLLILSPSSVESDEVQAEWRLAISEDKEIVPIIYQPCSIPHRLRLLQSINVASHSHDYEKSTNKILSSLGYVKNAIEPILQQKRPLEETIVNEGPIYHFIGLGALNIDYILPKKKIESLRQHTKGIFEDDFEPGTERSINLETVEKRINRIGITNFEKFCGGSAFNTIYAMSSLKEDLKLGFIGIAGRVEDGCDFKEKFRRAGIDDEFVSYNISESCGKCISYITADRSLQTSSPITRHLGDYLIQHREGILKRLSQTRYIHITSLFDKETPEIVNAIIKEAKKKNPFLMISVDPGYEYVMNEEEPYVRELLSMANIVFLNGKEFEEFGRGEDDFTKAHNIFHKISSNADVIVLKKYSSIYIFEKFHDRIHRQSFPNPEISEFEDDTGAGDVFAAGFLASQIMPVFRGNFKYGVQLGLNMVKQKFSAFGSLNYWKFPIVVDKTLDKFDDIDREG